MDEEEFEFALKVAFSSKDEGNIGWRGIGIWSGVAVCERVDITTKKKNGRELKASINSEALLSTENRQNKTAIDVLNESIAGIENIVTDIGYESYTKIELVGIHPSLTRLFNKKHTSDYLSKTVPLRFHADFIPGKEITTKLKEYGIPAASISVYINECEIYKDPTSSEDMFEIPFFEEFRDGDNGGGELLAVGWFVSTDKNKKLKDPSITYRKKGFRIGDTSLVELSSNLKYRMWQHGEIHVIEDNIVENAARDGFNAAVPETNILFSKVGRFITSHLETLSQYTSNCLASTQLDTAKKEFEKNNIKKVREQIPKIKNKGYSSKVLPSSLDSIRDAIDKKTKKEVDETEALMKKLSNKNTSNKSDKASDEDLLINRPIESLLGQISVSFDPLVKKEYNKRTKSGKHESNILLCDPLLKILRDVTGVESDSIATLSKEAFGWKEISIVGHNESKQKNVNYEPLLSIVGDLDDSNNRRRNKEFGVFLAFIWDFFNTGDRHMQLDKMPWYSQMTLSQKKEWNSAGWIMVDTAVKILRSAEKIKPK